MNIKKLVGIVILLSILILGCAGTYGKLKDQTATDDKVTIGELRNNWDGFDIYYGMRSSVYVDAIMFDPKDNGTKLATDSWIIIEDQKTLNQKIDEVNSIYRYGRVYIIEGKNNQFFGYMYYPGSFHVPLKAVDERTLYVGRPPKYRSAP